MHLSQNEKDCHSSCIDISPNDRQDNDNIFLMLIDMNMEWHLNFYLYGIQGRNGLKI